MLGVLHQIFLDNLLYYILQHALLLHCCCVPRVGASGEMIAVFQRRQRQRQHNVAAALCISASAIVACLYYIIYILSVGVVC